MTRTVCQYDRAGYLGILAMSLAKPEAETFKSIVVREPVTIGWPTLLDARMVLTGRGFPNAAAIIAQLVELSNVSAVTFGERHYHAAE